MPNWNTTSAIITGDKDQVMAFGKLIQELESLPESLLPNGFGKLWCGNIVHKLGEDWEKVYCRGWITDYEIVSANRINLSIESAWGELGEVRRLVLSKFPGIEIYHQSEEPGNLYFVTNSFEYFPERYILDFSDESRNLWLWEYFTSLEAAGLGQTGQNLAVVHLQNHPYAQLSEHCLHHLYKLQLEQLRTAADGVHVALVELAVTAFLRPVGAPYRLNLETLEGEGELALVLDNETGERNGEVVSETLFGSRSCGKPL